MVIEDDAVCRDLIYAAAVRIHQGYVGTIERRQVLVMETRALAELTIIRLQGFSGFFVFDNLSGSCSHTFHFLVMANSISRKSIKLIAF